MLTPYIFFNKNTSGFLKMGGGGGIGKAESRKAERLKNKKMWGLGEYIRIRTRPRGGAGVRASRHMRLLARTRWHKRARYPYPKLFHKTCIFFLRECKAVL